MCCEKSSLSKLDFFCYHRLHRHYKKSDENIKKSGFTIIEVLIVVLIIGILSSAAIGSYSGAIQDTRIRSSADRLQIFFQSCKERARLRNLEVKIIYDDKQKCFVNLDSTNSFLKIPELYKSSIPKLIEISKDGNFKIMGKETKILNLSLEMPDGNLATISINL